MPHIAGILMIVTGFAIMAFGLFLFYAWLPLFYGLFGLEIGLLVGRSLTGTVGATAIILGIAGAIFSAPRHISLSLIGAFCSASPAACCWVCRLQL